ncbi:hypothetical protein V490_02400 [Pseudogymnoascus sp. VKM F-3557]|nr:hypothetical protein V490_02400 [Pseudogymnoascus sp. VKM F-3557]
MLRLTRKLEAQLALWTLSAEGQSLRTGASKASLIVSAATLEKLPLELQVLILASAPDFTTLRDLVHASPVYHKAYASAKAIILSALIQTQQVPGTEVDSLAVLLSLDYADGMQDHLDEVIAFLDRYRHARGRGRWVNTKNPPLPVRWRPLQTDIDDLITMVKFQNLTEYLTDQFLEMEFQNTSVEPTSRMQIHNLFGGPWNCRAIWWLFFQTFPRWEHQEMWTILRFVTWRAKTIIETLIGDPEKNVWNLIPKSRRYNLAVQSITCAGPLFLAKAIRKKTVEQQYRMVIDNFECILFLRPDISNIASSIEAVCMVARGRPDMQLYPSDKFDSLTMLTDDAQDPSYIPCHEKPSAGCKWYLPYARFGSYDDAPKFEPSGDKKPWSCAFWDHDRLVKAGVVGGYTWSGFRNYLGLVLE